MSLYTVRYQAGTYSGSRRVHAEDEEQAIDKVRAQIRREMSLPMYADSYRVVTEETDTGYSDEDEDAMAGRRWD